MNTDKKPTMNTKRIPLIERLITSPTPTGLGYCCLWAFFTRNRRTAMIALRLGVTDRAIRGYKARFRDEEFQCEECEKCLKCVIK